MWIFAEQGYVSIVAVDPLKIPAQAGKLLCRGRFAGDLELLFPGFDVEETPPPADYGFRTYVPREIVGDRLAMFFATLTYTNFKAAVPDNDRHALYTRVWAILRNAQDEKVPPPALPLFDMSEALPLDDLEENDDVETFGGADDDVLEFVDPALELVDPKPDRWATCPHCGEDLALADRPFVRDTGECPVCMGAITVEELEG